MLYIIAICLLVVILTIYLVIKLVKYNKSEENPNKTTIIKSRMNENISDNNNFEFNLKENISNITTVPETSLYDYMPSSNLMKGALYEGWYPTKTSDNKYIVTIYFNKQVILRKARIYTGLSDNNNNYNGLIIRDEVDIIFEEYNIPDEKFNINKYKEIKFSNNSTTKCSFEFITDNRDIIIRNIQLFGIVKMKSKTEKLNGKIIKANDSSSIYENELINGVSSTLKNNATNIDKYISQVYNPTSNKVILKYTFDKVYSFLGLEITQLISDMKNYGYERLSFYSSRNVSTESYNPKYLVKILEGDKISTDQIENIPSIETSYYTYMVYFNPITDNDLILEFSGIDLDKFKLSKINFYGYDVVFSYYDNILINNINKEYLSLSEIELIDVNDVNILPDLVKQNKVNILQKPDDDTYVKMIKISKPKYTGSVFQITNNSQLDDYTYNINGAGDYALEIFNIFLQKENISDDQTQCNLTVINRSYFDLYTTSVMKVKLGNGVIKSWDLIFNFEPYITNYISNNTDLNPEIAIVFKEPLPLTIFRIYSASRTNGAKIELYNKYNKVISTYTINNTDYIIRLPSSCTSKMSSPVSNLYDKNPYTYSSTFPSFSEYKRLNPTENINGPMILINLKDPIILKAIKIKSNINSNDIIGANIIGANIIAYLSEKWANPLSSETSFKCFDYSTDYKNPYSALRINSSGNSECLSKDGKACDVFNTIEKCNTSINVAKNDYKNIQCSSYDCDLYNKLIKYSGCVNGNKGYNKMISLGNEGVYCLTERGSPICKDFNTVKDCTDAKYVMGVLTYGDRCTFNQLSNPDSPCGQAKLELLSNIYNSVYKVFEIPENEPQRNEYYFPLGIPIIENSLFVLSNNKLLCLDEFNSSNDQDNNAKLRNCNGSYLQSFRINNYRSNEEDTVGINKIYIPNVDKCLTYFNDKLIFRKCNTNMDYIQEFNLIDGKLKFKDTNKCVSLSLTDIFGNQIKDAVLTDCNNAESFQFGNFNNSIECTSFNCPNLISFVGDYTKYNQKYSIILDKEGMLILVTRNYYDNDVINTINLTTIMNNRGNLNIINTSGSSPYYIKIIDNGILRCYDKNDKVMWQSIPGEINNNPPYKISYSFLPNITGSVEIPLIYIENKNKDPIFSFPMF